VKIIPGGDMEKRKFMRFIAPLKVEAINEDKPGNVGLMKDFSREGLSVIFDDFESKSKPYLGLKIQKPGEDKLVFAIGEVIWKKQVEEKWEVGLRLREIPADAKAEILEYGYLKWLRDKGEVRI